jgi:hypothetical protein
MLGNSSDVDDGLCIVWLSTLEIPHTHPVQILQSWTKQCIMSTWDTITDSNQRRIYKYIELI